MPIKKISAFKIILVIVILLLITTTFCNSILADNGRSFYITKYNILININENGSANIEEYITYKFSGKFNGITLDIDLSKTKGLDNYEVFINKNDAQIEALENNSNLPGTYIFNLSNNMASFKVYEPSNNEEKTFVFKYSLNDVVVKYNDVAEFNRKMIGTGWEVPIENIHIRISLPKGATKEDIRVFGHGPLTGESEIIDSQNVEFRVPEISPKVFMETRVLFPNKLVPDSKNILSTNALQDILSQEKELAKKANMEREEAREFLRMQERKIKNLALLGKVLLGLLLPLWFLLMIFIYIKYDKEFKHRFFGQYFRELPGDYTPSEMSVLMSMGKVYPRDIMATLMDLVRKKYLTLEEVTVDKRPLLRTKKNTDYKISLNVKKSLTDLKSHESFLINWFINEIGNGENLLLESIKNYSKNTKTALDFKGSYDLWCEKVKTSAEQNSFFDKSAKTGRIIGVLTSLFFIASGIVLPVVLYTTSGVILFFQGIIMLIFSVRIKKRSEFGSEQYAKWKAFKRFLKDFSRLKEVEIPSIIIWEHYLVYAISLGIAKKVIKQLPLVFKEADLNNPSLTFLYGMSYGHFGNFERTFNSTVRTVENAVSTASAVAASKNSSLSGRGGGFSGGSSGGGGGGSGGGAF